MLASTDFLLISALPDLSTWKVISHSCPSPFRYPYYAHFFGSFRDWRWFVEGMRTQLLQLPDKSSASVYSWDTLRPIVLMIGLRHYIRFLGQQRYFFYPGFPRKRIIPHFRCFSYWPYKSDLAEQDFPVFSTLSHASIYHPMCRLVYRILGLLQRCTSAHGGNRSWQYSWASLSFLLQRY